MAEYYQFAHSVQGYNHIKANKVCQDASGECHFEDVSIIAVADGHGSDNYIRTDRGSKFAVSAALTAIKAFVQEARENHLSAVPDSETELIQISKNILARWYTQVENDVACEPFQPEELAKVSEKYKQRYASGQYNAKAYGTTLIAVCMTNEGWFGIHIGDGKCVELLENGTLCEPIPWDEACEQNITTSICDSDAIEEFRYIIQKDFPAAIFIGSDGIDDSYRSLLANWRMAYAPKNPEASLHPCFVASLHYADRVQYLLDILLQGSPNEKQQLLNGKEVTALGEAIERCKETEDAA